MTSAGVHPNTGACPLCAPVLPARALPVISGWHHEPMGTLAVTATISGVDGFFYILAVILLLIAAIVAWFVMPRQLWATFVAAALMLGFLAKLIK